MDEQPRRHTVRRIAQAMQHLSPDLALLVIAKTRPLLETIAGIPMTALVRLFVNDRG
jgi:hypothetical protein